MRHMKEAKREHELEEGDVGMRLTQEKAGRKEEDGKREMITPAVREALTKQGYKLIGSHSGVKLCRWTKGHNFLAHEQIFLESVKNSPCNT
ncbi:S-adenosyl-L-methionine-dependent tRNA 4-demethylwyosine synthase TYW1-like isoform 1-T2 [Amazona ochrocephala]